MSDDIYIAAGGSGIERAVQNPVAQKTRAFGRERMHCEQDQDLGF
jgi:hypothetical protein